MPLGGGLTLEQIKDDLLNARDLSIRAAATAKSNYADRTARKALEQCRN
jgi:hypothetical protein